MPKQVCWHTYPVPLRREQEPPWRKRMICAQRIVGTGLRKPRGANQGWVDQGQGLGSQSHPPPQLRPGCPQAHPPTHLPEMLLHQQSSAGARVALCSHSSADATCGICPSTLVLRRCVIWCSHMGASAVLPTQQCCIALDPLLDCAFG